MTTTTTSKSKAFYEEPPMLKQLLTILVGGVGGLIFMAIDVPAGAMSGAMAGIAVVGSIFPKSIVSLGLPLRYLAMMVSGVSIGATVTLETLRNILHYPVSVTGMMLCVVIMTALSTWVLSKFSGWNRPTALLASMPGAMSYILSIVMTTGADVPRVVAVQMFRVFFLVVLVPIVLGQTGIHIASMLARPTDPLWLFAIECVIGFAVGFFFMRMRMAGGMFFGAMLASGAFHAAGIAIGRAPGPILIAGQVLIGTWAGSRFIGFDWSMLLREGPSMLASIFISVFTSACFAAGVSWMLGLPFGSTFLAYSPGGFEAMTVLAMALGFDPFYVAAHHLARFFLLNIGLPLTLHYWIGEKKK